jgi:hypothetical protein
MKLKIFFMFIFSTALLLFAGCGEGSADGAKNSGFVKDAYQGGSEAVTFSFEDGAPPEKVIDQGKQPFNVRLTLDNKGEYTIPEGKTRIVLGGVDKEEFSITEDLKTLGEFGGVQKSGSSVRPGRTQVATFSNLRYVNDLESGTFSYDLVAEVCYPYETKAVTSLCISPDPTTSAYDENFLCDLEGPKDSASSGAPVKVENVQQRYQSDGIEFQFDIVHTGTGKVYKRDSLDDRCQMGENDLVKDVVKFTVDAGVGSGLECGGEGSGSGEVNLISGGKTTVYCTQKTEGEEEKQQLARITLEYDYYESGKQAILIEHVG